MYLFADGVYCHRDAGYWAGLSVRSLLDATIVGAFCMRAIEPDPIALGEAEREEAIAVVNRALHDLEMGFRVELSNP